MKVPIAITGLVIFMISCTKSQEEEPVTHKADYVQYMQDQNSTADYRLTKYNEEANFWTGKIKEQPNGYLYIQKLAAIRSRQFELTGNINLLYDSDSLLRQAAGMVSGKGKAANLISLSSNAIKKHQFRQALEYAYQAAGATEEKFGPLMMVFDASMELGDYDLAESILKQTKRLDNFHYLVRLSKFQDHEGDLDSAITLMEKAYGMIKNEKSELSLWALASLGDMHGHAGKLERSYDYYLQVLAEDPDYLHALQGIAWLAYSHDKNISEAKQILNYLSRKTALPDIHLILAEIAEFENRPLGKNAHHKAFIKEATQKKYLGMYNKYLIILHTEEYKDYNKALALAKQEVKNRPTPMAYALMAWVFHKKGEHKEALKLIDGHVEGITFEPEPVYYMGMIYAKNGQTKKAKKYLKEAGDAGFELGPLTSRIIDQTLNKL